MLKIALLVSIVGGGLISTVLYIIAYHRIAETFKELNRTDLFPKQESRLLYKSMIASIIVQIMLAISYTYFILYRILVIYNSVVISIFLWISVALLVATYVAQVIAFYRIGEDSLLIVENDPSPRYDKNLRKSFYSYSL
ncbi:MAG: hypothetical protein KGD64_12740 [Candidatus Heimdallarchaeota archaeon]|nr:hypothetical protein [Candidatus Heimdallarchaeota archaeon]